MTSDNTVTHAEVEIEKITPTKNESTKGEPMKDKPVKAENTTKKAPAKKAPTKKASAKDQEITSTIYTTLDVTNITAREDWNPKTTDEEWVKWIAASIKENGYLADHPIICKKQGNNYVVDDGHHRLLAVKQLGIKTVPTLVLSDKNRDETTSLLFTLIHNSSKNLTALEQGKLFQRLVDAGMTKDAIADRVGISRAEIYKKLELVEVGPETQKELGKGSVTIKEALATKKVVEETGKPETEALASLKQIKEQVKESKKNNIPTENTNSVRNLADIMTGKKMVEKKEPKTQDGPKVTGPLIPKAEKSTPTPTKATTSTNPNNNIPSSLNTGDSPDIIDVAKMDIGEMEECLCKIVKAMKVKAHSPMEKFVAVKTALEDYKLLEVPKSK